MNNTPEQPIHVLTYPNRPGLLRLVTNPAAPKDPRGGEVTATNDPNIRRVREYLYKIFQGDGQNSYCPFSQILEASNSYHLIQEDEDPSKLDLGEQVHRIKRDFTYLSPGRTELKKPFDLTSLVLSFGHPEAVSDDFLEKLKEVHRKEKQSFLNQGRMFAYMHPDHQIGGRTTFEGDERRMFNSGIPMLVVRRMHRSDLSLLDPDKPEQIAAYRRMYAS